MSDQPVVPAPNRHASEPVGEAGPAASVAATPAEDGEGYYAAYGEFSRTLRTWLVAYGVGGPLLFVSSEKVLAAVARSGYVGQISALFLAGVVLQVTVTLLNKAAMWACYYGSITPDFCSRRRYRLCHWFADQFWIDVGVDLATLVLFAVGTWWVIDVLSRVS